MLYLSRSLIILSYSSLVRSPESRKVLTNSFASLVETLDAFAMTDARNADALAGSMEDAERTSFMSYLKGLILWVLSMDCLLVDSLVLGLPPLPFLLPPDPDLSEPPYEPPEGLPAGLPFFASPTKIITPNPSNRKCIFKKFVSLLS